MVSQEHDGSDTAGLTDTELDQLADYLADALDPSDAAEVEQLIAENARWSAAHALLVPADAAIHDALATMGPTAGPMPADIAARLDDALRDLSRTAVVPSISESGASEDSRPELSLVRTTGDPSPSVAGAKSVVTMPTSLAAARSRRKRLLTRVTVAAAAVVAIIGGVSVATNLIRQVEVTTASGAADNAAAPGSDAGGKVPPAAPTGPRVIASGTNYTSTTLSQLSTLGQSVPDLGYGASSGIKTPRSGAKEAAAPVPQAVRDLAPLSLSRLLDPTALTSCLDAIRTVTPGSVLAVDYAQFAGEPALVVLLRQAGMSTIVAVGPNCGRAGPDEKGSAQVA